MPFFKLNDVFAGRYLLGELMVEGEASEVWKAKDQLADDALVVLKMYLSEKELNKEGLRKIRKEFTRSQYLSHPHLLNARHFDITEGIAYLVMPYFPKGPLSTLMEEERREKAESSFSERQVALVMSQIGSALATLHKQEPPIPHGAVNPDNIGMAQQDSFLLLDYQIRDIKGHSMPESRGGKKLHTKAYAPPESFDPYQKTDTSGDIFSLGATLYESCALSLPWGESGSRILLKREMAAKLPAQYSAELNELLQACMSVDSDKRPTAEELHLRGKHFLETGQWSLPGAGDKNGWASRNLVPYLLAAAVFALLLIGGFWAYQNQHMDNPIAGFQKMAVSVNQDKDKEVNDMLIAVLEEELEEVTRRNDSLKTILLKTHGPLIAENPRQAANNSALIGFNTARNSAESSSAAPASPPGNENTELLLTKKLEEQLNRISNPNISTEAREAWKEETMAQFSEGTIRIVDETEGKPKHYSAGIFLNLLMNVPHTIAVKEVKRDNSKKVTELRLTMETKM